MASSISSERTFSQGGITISKHHNRLKGDIVEALQCIKCAVRHDLLFREPGPSSVEEDYDDYEIETDSNEKPTEDEDEEEGWEALFLDDDSVESDFEIDG
jgi:hypothetical protein